MSRPASDPRRLIDEAQAIWWAGVRAVDGERAVGNAFAHPDESGGDLVLPGCRIGRDTFDRIFVIGAGKAGAAMARGLDGVLKEHGLGGRVVDSWINVPDGTADSGSGLGLFPARPAGSNLPTRRVLEGTASILRIVEQMTDRDLCLCLISGGGSALLASPTPPVTLQDKRNLAEFLGGRGADITRMNLVRRRISEVKGGGLARRCGGGRIVSLIVSDIPGDPIELIASGPTALTADDRDAALAVLRQFDPERTHVSERIYAALEFPAPARASRARVTNLVIAGNERAVAAGAAEAGRLGYETESDQDSVNDTDCRQAARTLADWALRALEGKRPRALVSGGEPVVRLCDRPGQGGRNQQVIIEALDYLCDHPGLQGSPGQMAILSAGTDGEDGTTTAAGAWLDRGILDRARSDRRTVADHRARNDAHPLFERFGNLLDTGPTGTNVCDLRIVLVAPAGAAP